VLGWAVGKVPDEWIYDETVNGSILKALQAAAKISRRGVCDQLVANPIKASWEDATKELLSQYRELIAANLPIRQARATVLDKIEGLFRAVLVLGVSLMVLFLSLRRTYRRAIQVWARLNGLWFIADVLDVLPDTPDTEGTEGT